MSAALQRVSASAQSKQIVVVVDTPTLIQVAARSGYPTVTDDGGGGDGVASYLDAVPVKEPCSTLDQTYAPLRSAAPGPSLTLAVDGGDSSGSVSLCGGVTDEALLRKNFGGGDGENATVGPYQGLTANDDFVGSDSATGTTLVRDRTPPTAIVDELIGGTTAEASLWQDPDVVATLSQMPGAAVVVMGSQILGVSPTLAPSAIQQSMARVAAREDAGRPPVPEFGGFGWVPGERRTGTSVFVTRYGSDEEAATAASILTAVWQDLGTSKFSGAVTQQQGSLVVTVLRDTSSAEFAFQGWELAEYPGFLGRS
ncbi:MAG: hypothetical protein INR72_09355 [Williamsia herbipolensis]|nr:hypothetical protein [Williamsia herbipolensis]